MAKRRRMNGMLEDAPLLGEPEDAALNEPGGIGAGAVPAFPPGLEPTEVAVPLPQPKPGRAPEARNGPPEAVPIGDASVAAPVAVPVASLEQRIRRLEDALAQIQESRSGEHRVTARAGQSPAPASAAEPAMQAPTDKLWEFGKRVLESPVEAAKSLAGSTPEARASLAWLFKEAITEARAIFRMFTDPRYRLSWTGRIAPPVLTFLIVSSWWWVPFTSLPVFGSILDKAIDLVLAFVLFKLLAFEARRYRETAPDLPAWLRL